jgi:ATP-dependent Clp protease ATP-binding subunit ClpA
MKLSTGLEIAVSFAAREAHTRRHEFMTVEYLLLALMHDESTAKVLKKSGANLDKLRTGLEKALAEEQEQLPEGTDVDPMPTMGFQRVLQRAAWHVDSSGKEELRGENVLVAMFAEPDSTAVALLLASGTSRLDIVSYISHGASSDENDEYEAGQDMSDVEEEDREEDPLERYATHLNERTPLHSGAGATSQKQPASGRRCWRRKNCNC